jgi:hypothetical protein
MIRVEGFFEGILVNNIDTILSVFVPLSTGCSRKIN